MANKIDKEKDNKLLHDAMLKHKHRAELAAALGNNDRAVEARRIAVWLCELEKIRLQEA